MQIRLAASTTAIAFVLAACGSSSEDFRDSPGLHGGSGGSNLGNTGGAGARTAGSGQGGTTSGGTSASSSGGNAVGGSNGMAGGTNPAGGTAGSAVSGSGGSAGKSAMDSGASGMPAGGGGIGSGGSGRPGAGGSGGMPCGGETGCPPGSPGGHAGRSMGGAGGGATAGAGGAVIGAAGGGACPASGHISYTLTKAANPTSDQQAAYDLITPAMDEAVHYYNCYTNITKADTVTYDPSVETADGNFNGSIRFGGTDYMEYITAMHEIAHSVGVGTAPAWPSLVVNGIFTGAHATAELRMITGNPDDMLNADTQHFWPYGLNYTSEVKSEADVIDHCLMVAAIRLDEGFNP